MEIQVTPKTARENVLRVWLARVPEESGIIYAFRPNQDPAADAPVGEAHLFGRGFGSDAMERVMLIFHLKSLEGQPDYSAGETLKLMTRNEDGRFEDITLDVLAVE